MVACPAAICGIEKWLIPVQMLHGSLGALLLAFWCSADWGFSTEIFRSCLSSGRSVWILIQGSGVWFSYRSFVHPRAARHQWPPGKRLLWEGDAPAAQVLGSGLGMLLWEEMGWGSSRSWTGWCSSLRAWGCCRGGAIGNEIAELTGHTEHSGDL